MVASLSARIGVVGMSEGNGHPYSWSAIFNGYDRVAMENCGFPVIPRYLEEQRWPDARIPNAEVVAAWTQDNRLSEHLAAAANIPKVCRTYDELLDSSDAILLARDDAENHWSFVEPALRLGKPIYIDKPIALRVNDLDKIYEAEQYPGQVFTCSALRYADELTLAEKDFEEIGVIHSIIAVTPKSWAKYGVHIIEAVLKNLHNSDEPVEFAPSGLRHDGGASLTVHWESGIETELHAMGTAQASLNLSIHGAHGVKELAFNQPFYAFRAALSDFFNLVMFAHQLQKTA